MHMLCMHSRAHMCAHTHTTWVGWELLCWCALLSTWTTISYKSPVGTIPTYTTWPKFLPPTICQLYTLPTSDPYSEFLNEDQIMRILACAPYLVLPDLPSQTVVPIPEKQFHGEEFLLIMIQNVDLNLYSSLSFPFLLYKNLHCVDISQLKSNLSLYIYTHGFHA